MPNKWSFDKQFLINCINKGNILLENPNLTKSDKTNIKFDLLVFKQFLNDNFEYLELGKPKTYKTIEEVKERVLNKMKKHYTLLGENLINWIIALEQTRIFDIPIKGNKTNLPVEKQAQLTILNYQTHSNILLQHAKNLLSPHPTNKIQIVKELETSSYMHFSSTTRLPYLIINPEEAPWVLNHEIEHGIENIASYTPHKIYEELGAIYFELLFTDLLYKEQGYINPGDCFERTIDTLYDLSFLAEYLEIVKIFAKINFEVPTNIFKQVFLDNLDINEEELLQYLNEEIINDGIDLCIQYSLSYLKAIELREITKTYQGDILNLLLPYLKNKRFKFIPPENYYSIYQKYLEETEQKTKKLNI